MLGGIWPRPRASCCLIRTETRLIGPKSPPIDPAKPLQSRMLGQSGRMLPLILSVVGGPQAKSPPGSGLASPPVGHRVSRKGRLGGIALWETAALGAWPSLQRPSWRYRFVRFRARLRESSGASNPVNRTMDGECLCATAPRGPAARQYSPESCPLAAHPMPDLPVGSPDCTSSFDGKERNRFAVACLSE